LGYFHNNPENDQIIAKFRREWVTINNGCHKIKAPNPPEYNEAKFRRCLAHIALNYVAWKFGVDYALKDIFDPIRKYVRYGCHNKAWPYGQVLFEDDKPRKHLGIGLAENGRGHLICFNSYIDDFYIDPLNEVDLKDFISGKQGKELLYFP